MSVVRFLALQDSLPMTIKIFLTWYDIDFAWSRLSNSVVRVVWKYMLRAISVRRFHGLKSCVRKTTLMNGWRVQFDDIDDRWL